MIFFFDRVSTLEEQGRNRRKEGGIQTNFHDGDDDSYRLKGERETLLSMVVKLLCPAQEKNRCP